MMEELKVSKYLLIYAIITAESAKKRFYRHFVNYNFS